VPEWMVLYWSEQVNLLLKHLLKLHNAGSHALTLALTLHGRFVIDACRWLDGIAGNSTQSGDGSPCAYCMGGAGSRPGGWARGA